MLSNKQDLNSTSVQITEHLLLTGLHKEEETVSTAPRRRLKPSAVEIQGHKPAETAAAKPQAATGFN